MNKQTIIESSFYPAICKINNVFGLKIKRLNNGEYMLAKNALFRKSKIVVNGNENLVKIGNKCRFRNLTIEVCGKNNTIEIMDSVMVYEKCYISIKGDNCNCIIGKNTTIGSARFFLEESETSITIGEDCMLGRDVCLQTTDFHSIVEATTGKRINYPESVSVGNHIWLGYGVTLGKGSSVADNSVVGEHTLVTKQFTQPNVCLVGIPAKIIKENINWNREKLT